MKDSEDEGSYEDDYEQDDYEADEFESTSKKGMKVAITEDAKKNPNMLKFPTDKKVL